MARTRVFIVDDSPLARGVIADALARDPSIEVVGTASDALFARDKLARLSVDVVTLDLEMPRLDGLSFLRAMLAVRPLPTIVISAFSPRGSETALRALELGAVDVLPKPRGSLDEHGDAFAAELVEKVKVAARASVHPRRRAPATGKLTAPAPLESRSAPARSSAVDPRAPIVLLGASTGGCAAIPEILSTFPRDAPPVVCVQHIAASFSASFAARLDALGNLRAAEARSGDVLEPGHVYVAPGGSQLILVGAARPVLQVQPAGPRDVHRPCIDVTFRSAAALGPRILAALLTGMGADGADGLRAIRDAGGFTLAQDEATSVVYGMPREAAQRGAACVVAPLDAIADRLLLEARRRRPS
jgi:two-component system chemotaxis response regulator CheB